jgi:hypothetical protein
MKHYIAFQHYVKTTHNTKEERIYMNYIVREIGNKEEEAKKTKELCLMLLKKDSIPKHIRYNKCILMLVEESIKNIVRLFTLLELKSIQSLCYRMNKA